MAEAFLLLLAAGIMLAVAVPNPRDVTLNWLRLGGIISLALVALSAFLSWRATGWNSRMQSLGVVAIPILAHLAVVQINWRHLARILTAFAFLFGVFAATQIWHPHRGKLDYSRDLTIFATSAGIAAMTGSVLMSMLLGHAYLTASKMTIRPFRTMSWWMIAVLLARAACAAGWTMWLQHRQPLPTLWPIHGFLIITRWAVGLGIPFVFILMAHDCIKRRSTQSATGILYVAGVLIFIGELLALHLARETELPF